MHGLTSISPVPTGLARNIAHLFVLFVQLLYDISGTLFFGSYCGSHGPGSALDGRQPSEGASATERARVGMGR